MAERTARLVIDRAAVTDAIDRRLFGSFIEHLGLYQPGHPEADSRGYRQDVIKLVKELGVSVDPVSGRQLCFRIPVGRWSRTNGAETTKA